MKMFKNILVLGFLLISITALSRAQDETATTEAADAAADAVPGADDATNPDDDGSADDKKSKVKGKSSDSTVVDDILTFMKETCDKIIKFISGKKDGGVAGKTGSDDEAETTTESPADDALAGASKKAKKVLDKVGKKGKKDKSDESEE